MVTLVIVADVLFLFLRKKRIAEAIKVGEPLGFIADLRGTLNIVVSRRQADEVFVLMQLFEIVLLKRVLIEAVHNFVKIRLHLGEVKD